ncbi:hypothetical protein IWW36_000465 [Coemansia brasiliensis]|uniref:glucan endo-1,3-beta-D-glucosidase n=1 Tax=Coemansia brasiliensis TaxID=2650707 RepID=A0A9W8IJT5_9FUNG|nr:hypothetical protein IWW36_000465 [Coemansia brasiliensis]
MRACISSWLLAAIAGSQLVSAAPIAAISGGVGLAGRDNGIAVDYVPASVDWSKVDWSQVNWSAVNWDAVNWQSVFSSRDTIPSPSETTYSSAQDQLDSAVAISAPVSDPAPELPSKAPEPSSAAPEPSPVAPEPSPVVPEPSPAVPKPSSAAPEPSPPAPTTTSKPEYTSSSPPPKPEPSTSAAPEPETPSNSGGSLWGLTYSPYNTDGSCPDLATVSSQLKKIAQVTGNIRLYSTDCSQLRLAVQAIKNNNIGLTIHPGIWVSEGAARMQSDLDEFVSVVKQYGSDIIDGLSVGNEETSKGMSESTLIGYINQARSRLQAEGLGHIPVFTTEQDAHFTSSLASVCDLVQVNIYSVFDSIFTSIDASVKSVIQRADNIRNNVAGGKPVRFGETGWSSAGNTGPSPLSLVNEIAYAQKFKCAAASAGYDYFYFEAKNALWKQGEPDSEQNFGIFSADFVPKFDFGLLNYC